MTNVRVCKNCGVEYPLDDDHFPSRRNDNYASVFNTFTDAMIANAHTTWL